MSDILFPQFDAHQLAPAPEPWPTTSYTLVSDPAMQNNISYQRERTTAEDLAKLLPNSIDIGPGNPTGSFDEVRAAGPVADMHSSYEGTNDGAKEQAANGTPEQALPGASPGVPTGLPNGTSAGASTGTATDSATGLADKPNSLESALSSVRLSQERQESFVLLGSSEVRRAFNDLLAADGKLYFQGGTPILTVNKAEAAKYLQRACEMVPGALAGHAVSLKVDRSTSGVFGGVKDGILHFIGKRHEIDVFVAGKQEDRDTAMQQVKGFVKELQEAKILPSDDNLTRGKSLLPGASVMETITAHAEGDLLGVLRPSREKVAQYEEAVAAKKQARDEARLARDEKDDAKGSKDDPAKGAAKEGELPTNRKALEVSQTLDKHFAAPSSLGEDNGKKQVNAVALLYQAAVFKDPLEKEVATLPQEARHKFLAQTSALVEKVTSGEFDSGKPTGKGKEPSEVLDKPRNGGPSLREKMDAYLTQEVKSDPTFAEKLPALMQDLVKSGVITQEQASAVTDKVSAMVMTEQQAPAIVQDHSRVALEPNRLRDQLNDLVTGSPSDVPRDKALAMLVELDAKQLMRFEAMGPGTGNYGKEQLETAVKLWNFVSHAQRGTFGEEAQAYGNNLKEALKNWLDNSAEHAYMEGYTHVDHEALIEGFQAQAGEWKWDRETRTEWRTNNLVPDDFGNYPELPPDEEDIAKNPELANWKPKEPEAREEPPQKMTQEELDRAEAAIEAYKDKEYEEYLKNPDQPLPVLAEKDGSITVLRPVKPEGYDERKAAAELAAKGVAPEAGAAGHATPSPDAPAATAASTAQSSTEAALNILGSAPARAQAPSQDSAQGPVQGAAPGVAPAAEQAATQGVEPAAARGPGAAPGASAGEAPLAGAPASAGGANAATAPQPTLSPEEHRRMGATEAAAGALLEALSNPPGAFTRRDKSWNESAIERLASKVMQLDHESVARMPQDKRDAVILSAFWLADQARNETMPGFSSEKGRGFAAQLVSKATALSETSPNIQVSQEMGKNLDKANRMLEAMAAREQARTSEQVVLRDPAARVSEIAEGSANVRGAHNLAQDLVATVYQGRTVSAVQIKSMLKNASRLNVHTLKGLDKATKARTAVALRTLVSEVKEGALGDYSSLSASVRKLVGSAAQSAQALESALGKEPGMSTELIKAHLGLADGAAPDKQAGSDKSREKLDGKTGDTLAAGKPQGQERTAGAGMDR